MLTLKREPPSDTSVRRVGLLSDTHIPTKAKRLPSRVFDLFQNVNFIIHAGDLVSLEVVDALKHLAPVVAVHGNMDGSAVREALPEMTDLTIDRCRIGVIHDPGVLIGRGKLRVIAEENNFDVLVYGHTHHPSTQWEDGRLFINPGSPTNPLPPFLVKPTVAILTLSEGTVEPEIVSLKK
jgi:putative phosphoesterase